MFEIAMSKGVGGARVVTVVGDVDLASLPRLATALADVSGDVVLDLRGVDFLDPVCLGALVALDLRVRRAGAGLTLRVGSAVQALLQETRLDRILAIEAGPGDAGS